MILLPLSDDASNVTGAAWATAGGWTSYRPWIGIGADSRDVGTFSTCRPG